MREHICCLLCASITSLSEALMWGHVVSDSLGNSIMLGTFTTSGSEYGPFFYLYGSQKTDGPTPYLYGGFIKFDVRIPLNNEGNFEQSK